MTMKMITAIVATSIEYTPLLIVSAPSVAPVNRLLLGSFRRAVGRLPAVSTLARSSDSGTVKPPLISPRS